MNVFHFDINIGINLFLLPDDSYFHALNFPLPCISLLLGVSLYFSVLEIFITRVSVNHDRKCEPFSETFGLHNDKLLMMILSSSITLRGYFKKKKIPVNLLSSCV